jgi:hypothetical protein
MPRGFAKIALLKAAEPSVCTISSVGRAPDS